MNLKLKQVLYWIFHRQQYHTCPIHGKEKCGFKMFGDKTHYCSEYRNMKRYWYYWVTPFAPLLLLYKKKWKE